MNVHCMNVRIGSLNSLGTWLNHIAGILFTTKLFALVGFVYSLRQPGCLVKPCHLKVLNRHRSFLNPTNPETIHVSLPMTAL